MQQQHRLAVALVDVVHAQRRRGRASAGRRGSPGGARWPYLRVMRSATWQEVYARRLRASRLDRAAPLDELLEVVSTRARRSRPTHDGCRARPLRACRGRAPRPRSRAALGAARAREGEHAPWDACISIPPRELATLQGAAHGACALARGGVAEVPGADARPGRVAARRRSSSSWTTASLAPARRSGAAIGGPLGAHLASRLLGPLRSRRQATSSATGRRAGGT